MMNKMKWICLWGILVVPSLNVNAKVLLITHAYNQPEFIKWQDAALKKFLKDEYEYVVFNDASNLAMQQRIEADWRPRSGQAEKQQL